MKKTLLFVCTFFGLASIAQTLNQSNHSYLPGYQYSTIPCSTVGVTSGASGAGSSWNYASVATNTSAIVNYSATTNTNTTYSPADVFVNGGSNNSAYYKSSATDMKYYGGDISVSGNNVTLIYAIPAIYAVYPMNLNSTNTAMISGSLTILGNSATFTGQCSITADATGTLTIPSGNTYSNTIRVLTTQTITTSSLPFVGVATIYMQNFDYYDPSTAIAFKAPLFSIANSTLSSGAGNSVQTFANTLKDNTVGINELHGNSLDLNVFPNPTTNFVNFSTPSVEAVKVIVFDMSGKALATEVIENGKSTINTTSFAGGVYMYHVTDKNNRILTTGKFTVSK